MSDDEYKPPAVLSVLTDNQLNHDGSLVMGILVDQNTPVVRRRVMKSHCLNGNVVVGVDLDVNESKFYEIYEDGYVIGNKEVAYVLKKVIEDLCKPIESYFTFYSHQSEEKLSSISENDVKKVVTHSDFAAYGNAIVITPENNEHVVGEHFGGFIMHATAADAENAMVEMLSTLDDFKKFCIYTIPPNRPKQVRWSYSVPPNIWSKMIEVSNYNGRKIKKISPGENNIHEWTNLDGSLNNNSLNGGMNMFNGVVFGDTTKKDQEAADRIKKKRRMIEAKYLS